VVISGPGAALVLHSVRLLGFADSRRVAERFDLDPHACEELLGDYEARGLVSKSTFAEHEGWSLTSAGKVENERMLQAELTGCGGTQRLGEIYEDFLPVNIRAQRACTNWQLRPTASDPLHFNDHTDPGWDNAVIEELAEIALHLRDLSLRLVDVLPRFNGYDFRFEFALDRVRSGEPTWVNRTDADSCHTVWFQLHEDLLATLQLPRTG
jgi:hypothetical protein